MLAAFFTASLARKLGKPIKGFNARGMELLAAPQVKGATATNQTKDATLETGLMVKVPPFIENGEVLRIDTRSGEYLERA